MFSKFPWKKGLTKSKTEAFGWINEFFIKPEITESTWEELEERLIKADVGLSVSTSIVNNLHQLSRKNGIKKTSDLKSLLREELLHLVHKPEFSMTIPKPMVVMLVGVNGSGKTTTIAKLAKYYQSNNKSVLFVGADTYRAAAVEQLTVWARALDVPIISGQAGSDPGAVVFDGIQHAMARDIDIVLIDTAGRLHTKYNLMEELRKIHRVAGKSLSGAPHEVWLILDSTTGQNALSQARVFKEAINISGIILAKLDSSSKGGMIFAIEKELNVPILFTGLGETVDDLVIFDPEAFVDEIIGDKPI